MSPEMITLLVKGLSETLYMVTCSSILAALFGVPIGVILLVTNSGHIMPNIGVNRLLGVIVNAGRSIPFIILMIAIIPFTRLIIGTSIGTAAAIVPLTVAAIPFFARIVETALFEVDKGLVEASQSMGASPLQIITKVLLPEAAPALIAGFTLMVVNLIGYSAMAGVVGGGGLGDIAIRYGYQRFQGDVMVLTVLIMIFLVQIIQVIGDKITVHFNKRKL